MSNPPRIGELQTGDVFGGYEIVRQLGVGGFGAVYEAVRLGLRKRTALKVLHPELARDPDVLERFLREAQIVAQVEHPHIVAVFDVGVHDARPYIAMEYLDGQSLADRIDHGGPMSAADTVDLMLPVLSALATVHARGIVHRDLKPDNIYLARQPTGAVAPKLLDFGIAKVREAGRPLTATNAIMGTPNYMSPEQARESRSIDAQSDQWSLAVIVFECLLGRCPIQGDNLLALLVAIANDPLPRLCDLSPGQPPALEAILLRAMDRDPTLRWSSVRAFGEALLPFASPAARAHWAGFFTGAGVDVLDFARPSATPSAAVARRGPEAYGSTGIGRRGTLEPETRSSVDPPPHHPRRALLVTAATVGLAALVGVGATLSLRALAHETPDAVPPPRAASAPPRVTPPPPPAPPPIASTEIVPSPVAAAVIADAGAPAELAVEAPASPATRARRHGRHRRREATPGEQGSAFPSF